jgi:hypothetical protein
MPLKYCKLPPLFKKAIFLDSRCLLFTFKKSTCVLYEHKNPPCLTPCALFMLNLMVKVHLVLYDG